MKRTIVFAAALAATLIGAAGPAEATGLSSKVAGDVRREVSLARASDPGAFVALREAVGKASAIDARARGHKAPIALYLHGMGKKALLPMLEMLAFESPDPALKRDLVEAVGLMRDARALPVLAPMLDEEAEPATVRAVTEAVARLGTEDAALRMSAALARAEAAKDTARARAILSAMGECRRPAVVRVLAARARDADDGATLVVARSLGRVGNAWAWKTMADRSEEASVRETSARALVDLFVRHGGEARDAASNALMVVDDPHTPALIAEARRAATAQTAGALDALAARFAVNPSR